jgi:hypothetical protein
VQTQHAKAAKSTSTVRWEEQRWIEVMPQSTTKHANERCAIKQAYLLVGEAIKANVTPQYAPGTQATDARN